MVSSIRRLVCAVLCGGLMASASAGEVRVAVASNFSAPMAVLAALFQQESGHTLKLSLGSSGKLLTQIESGAPFDVFLSADETGPKRLEEEGLAVGGSRFVYAQGKLVLWSAQPGLVDKQGAILRRGDYRRLAVADPKLAPYGMAAKETLEALGVWSAAQPKLVTGENITQTYQFVATGNADLAFLALSQVTRDCMVNEGSWWLVPSELYRPIRQGAVQLSATKDAAAAQAFLTFLKSAKAAELIRGFGYGAP